MRFALDVIVDTQGIGRVVEANPYPIDVVLADSLKRKNRLVDNDKTIFDAIIDASLREPRELFILVLSPRYRLREGAKPQKCRLISLCQDRSDPSVSGVQLAHSVLAQYNAIGRRLSKRGIKWIILPGDMIDCAEVRNSNSVVMFHRGVVEIPKSLLTDELCSAVGFEFFCRDKLLFYRDCSRLSAEWTIETIPFSDAQSYEFINDNRFEFHILKPRFGFGGRDVIRFSEASEIITDRKDLLIQPWVKSIELSSLNRKQFELRVHVVRQEIISIYAKIAISPDNLLQHQNELGWCTCIGSSVPIQKGGALESELLEAAPNLKKQIRSIVQDIYHAYGSKKNEIDVTNFENDQFKFQFEYNNK